MNYKKLMQNIKDSDFLSENLKEDINELYDDYLLLLEKQNKASKDVEHYQKVIRNILKNKIGEKIYWASKNWEKYETHTITNVKFRKFDSDFFDTKEVKHKGQWRVIIEVDNNGHYLADDIGETLFFSEDEARKHAKSAD